VTAIVPLEPGADAAAEKLRDLVGGKVYTDRAEQKLLARQSPGAQVFVFLATSYGQPEQRPAPVRILNASGRPGYGDEIAARLRARGIEVASVDVAEPRLRTEVGRPRSAYALSRRVIRLVRPRDPYGVHRTSRDDPVIELVLGQDTAFADILARALSPRDVSCTGYGRGAAILCHVDQEYIAFRPRGTECFVGRSYDRPRHVLRGCDPRP
jgi:hypothetical protein